MPINSEATDYLYGSTFKYLNICIKWRINQFSDLPYYTDEGKNTVSQGTKEKKDNTFFDNHSIKNYH